MVTSILDVSPGMRVEEAREKLNKLSDPKTPPMQEGGDEAEDEGAKSEAANKDNDAATVDHNADKEDADAPERKIAPPGAIPGKKQVKGGDDDDEGTRILWKLAPGSAYQWVFIIADKDEKITAVFGYCWPDKPIPFDEIGDVSKAPVHSPEQVAWDSLKPPLHYRITADGSKEHASQVSIFFAAARTNGVHQAARRE